MIIYEISIKYKKANKLSTLTKIKIFFFFLNLSTACAKTSVTESIRFMVMN